MDAYDGDPHYLTLPAPHYLHHRHHYLSLPLPAPHHLHRRHHSPHYYFFLSNSHYRYRLPLPHHSSLFLHWHVVRATGMGCLVLDCVKEMDVRYFLIRPRDLA